MSTEEELTHLRRQVTELQLRGTELVNENRTLRHQVRMLRAEANERAEPIQAEVAEFFGIAGQEVGGSPHVPSRARLQLHLRVMAEECIETIEACGAAPTAVADLKLAMAHAIEGLDHSRVDLVELADGCVDTIYTALGVLTACGIEFAPLWREVSDSNLMKKGGPVVDGKLRKPPGWRPPDIRGALIRQGWEEERRT